MNIKRPIVQALIFLFSFCLLLFIINNKQMFLLVDYRENDYIKRLSEYCEIVNDQIIQTNIILGLFLSMTNILTSS